MQNENTNTMSVTTNIKNIYRLEINVKTTDNTLVETQNIDFQALDIASVQNESLQEELNVADVNTRTTSSVQTSHDSKSLGVSYTSNGSYAWMIPSEINLNKQDTLTVSATKINEEANASLRISVSSENGFNMKSNTGQSGAYNIASDGKQITNNQVILETTSAGTSTVDLKFSAYPGNFMTAGTYNDTLTFKAQNGYATGTVLESEGMKFIVIGQTDNDTYLVMTKDSIKTKMFQTSPRVDNQNINTYEKSEIDCYLEDDWYNTLPQLIKNAIQFTDIKQVSYSDRIDLSSRQESGYNNQIYNVISRHVYLPNISEISNVVDLMDKDKTKAFLDGKTIWVRDSFKNTANGVLCLHCVDGMINISDTFAQHQICPAFVIDLSKVNATVVDTVHYK